MNNESNDRLGQIEALLERSIVASDERMTRLEQSMVASDGRLTRIENLVESNHRESNERMTRVESGLERLEQATRSNNRFLESFSTDIRRYVDTMNNLATRIDGVIATSNQDRMETNSRLQVIQRQVSAIAKHLGVGNQ